MNREVLVIEIWKIFVKQKNYERFIEPPVQTCYFSYLGLSPCHVRKKQAHYECHFYSASYKCL